MKCKYCNSEIKKDDINCNNCGNDLTIEDNSNNQFSSPNMNQNNLGQDGYNYPPIPPQRVPTKTILLSMLAFFACWLILHGVLFFLLTYESPNKRPPEIQQPKINHGDIDWEGSTTKVIGTWHCSKNEASTEYVITATFKNDRTFIWNKYNDEQNNHIYGEIISNLFEKNDSDDTYSYYPIILYGEEYVKNSVLQEENYKMELKVGINKNNKSKAIMIDQNAPDIFYCDLEKTEEENLENEINP
jgi:hypothetical protein